MPQSGEGGKLRSALAPGWGGLRLSWFEPVAVYEPLVDVVQAPSAPEYVETAPRLEPTAGYGAHRRRRRLKRRVSPWLLPAILAFQAALSIRLVWANTAFNDEALYLWSGHLEIAHLLHGTNIPEFQTYFSGAPVIYPILGAAVDSYGGLAAARLLSLAFMLAATCLLYATTRRLFGRTAGVIAAALFAFLGPVQYLGAFATYDAMALFLISLAAFLTVIARRRLSEPLLIMAALVLALADATKYSAALWDPVVILLAIFTATRGEWLRKVLRGVRFAVYVSATITIAIFHNGGNGYISGILFTTIARQAGAVPSGVILRDSAYWIGILLLVALRGIVISDNPRTRMLCVTLAGAVLLAPLEQARIHTETSLDKHVAFGAWFGAIAAGYVLARAVEKSKYAKWRIAAGTALLIALFGFIQANTFYAAWPNSRSIVSLMRNVENSSSGRTLAEQGAVVDYYLNMPPARLTDTFGFSYRDGPKANKLKGTLAYVDAIHAHAFAVIELDFSFTARRARDDQILAAVENTPGYHLVATAPWRSNFGHNLFMLWKYEPRER